MEYFRNWGGDSSLSEVLSSPEFSWGLFYGDMGQVIDSERLLQDCMPLVDAYIRSDQGQQQW